MINDVSGGYIAVAATGPAFSGEQPLVWKLCPRYVGNPVVFTLEKFHTTFTLAWKRRSGRRFSKCFKRIFIYLNNVFLFSFFFLSDKNVNFAIFHGINLFDYPSCVFEKKKKRDVCMAKIILLGFGTSVNVWHYTHRTHNFDTPPPGAYTRAWQVT